MQASVPEVMDISREPKHILDAYGAKPGAGNLANNILLARRLVEKGVRFVHLFDWGWDFHGTGAGTGLGDGLRNKCKTMDKPIAALIKDLKQRGLFDETLIVWGGEFGRTPKINKNAGRDHWGKVYSTDLAGAGINGGQVYGATDKIGGVPTDKPVYVTDFIATVYKALGYDSTTIVHDRLGRPHPIVQGNPVLELF